MHNKHQTTNETKKPRNEGATQNAKTCVAESLRLERAVGALLVVRDLVEYQITCTRMPARTGDDDDRC
jgi:hypothetical protein